MKVYNYMAEQDTVHEADGILEVLDPSKRGSGTLACFVGAGGKTSTILALARDLSACGKRVLITTTTHMQHPKANGYIYQNGTIEEERQNIRDQMKKHPFLIAGYEGSPTRIEGLPEKLMRSLMCDCDVMLVEGDGARRLPFKAPRAYEPVIPDWAGVIVISTGLDAIGCVLSSCTCRVDEVCAITGKASDSIVSERDVAQIMLHAYRRPQEAAFPAADFYYILNKADNKDRIESASRVYKHLCRMEDELGIKRASGYIITAHIQREDSIDEYEGL